MSEPPTPSPRGASSGPPLLQTRGVSKRFGDFTALNSASLEIHAGRTLGLVGSNGAGKSTLIRILTGAHAPTAGEVRVRGEPVGRADPARMRALGVACIYQHSSLVPTLDAIDNVFLGRQPRNRLGLVDRRDRRRRFDALVERYGIEVDPRAEVARLSPVAQKEVEILKALAGDADVILMDEPTAWLSLAEVANLHATIGRLAAAGKGIVYISHMLDEVFAVCDDVTILRDGAVVWSGPIGAIDRPGLVDRMVGEGLGAASRGAAGQERRPRGTGEARLRVRGLARRDAFEDVGFDAFAGEILCFAGLIGAGRSEVVRCVFGLDAPDAGTVEVDGEPFRANSPREAIRRGVCFVPEDRHAEGLCLEHSTLENIALPSLDALARRGVLDGRAMRAMCERQVRALNVLPPEPAKTVGRMSGGNQQKVLLGKWIERAPRVLVLDEPTVGVDVGAKAEIYATIRRLRDAGTAVLVVSSDLEEVTTLADRIVVFRAGRIVGTHDAGALAKEALVREIGGGEGARR